MGNTGLAVSRLCLGTMTFGHETDEAGAHEQLDTFVEAGGNFIDTADVYTRGVSEQIIGRWLAARPGMREQVVIATKGRFPMSDLPNGRGLSRRHLADALDASLRRLGVETIDLYQLHAFDALTPLEETLRFLDDAVSAGKVHYVGLSNFLGWQVAAISELARAKDRVAPVMLQPQYNLLTRHIELEVVPACQRYGIGLVPWSPLAGGWLSGKYSRDQRPTGATRLGEDPGRGMEAWDRRSTERTWRIMDELRAVADESGTTMAQAAIAWLADRPAVVAPILGSRTTAQLVETLGAADLHLDDEATRRLDEASAITDLPDYPYGELGVQQRHRDLA